MFEVEVKVRAEHDAVELRLERLDADRAGEVIQADTYYDAPHREFGETDEALRIRRERRPGEEADSRITYKGPLVDEVSKTREEVETGVADGDRLGAILEHLGFDPVATVEKSRERYAVDGYTVTLDDVTGLGEFVEVEREVAAGDVETAREGAFDLVDRLGLDADEGIRTSYLGMLLDGDGH